MTAETFDRLAIVALAVLTFVWLGTLVVDALALVASQVTA